MKIAIVGPSPVPYTIGGAENMAWGLCEAINQKTNHQAELIKLPLREYSFWELVESYYSFYNLDLSHFDAVIVTKYPSWMVRHTNKICYMVHTLRGLYDTYHFMGMPKDVKKGVPEIDELLCYMDENPLPVSLELFFNKLFRLKENQTIPQEYFNFPGPFIRKIIHYLDNCAMSMGVNKFAAISDTVRNRKEYYPENAAVETIYPPTTNAKGSCGEYRYVFMISRLDAPKRIDMLIEAMKYVKGDIQLLIAGTGPQEQELKKMAEGDSRIRFLGFVKDEEVEDYYANSLVIPYFPYDEDYGLITIEAMLHKKPVITTADAGGPTEFVENDQTGFVTEFDANAIAEKIEYFACNPKEAMRMGENGYNRVKNITWEKVIDQLLGRQREKKGIPEVKKKITVTSTFPIYPPRGGGQLRIYELYREVAKKMDVDIVSFGIHQKEPYDNMIAPGLREKRIRKTYEHQFLESTLDNQFRVPMTDIGMITLSGKTPEYGKRLSESMQNSCGVVISHPYLYREAKKYLDGKPFVYEAQDVEYLIKKDILPDIPGKKEYLEQIYEVEKVCCQDSAFITVCAESDKKQLIELYGIPEKKIVMVPNGVDCSKIRFISVRERLENKQENELAHEKLGVFIGSWHGPNLEACEKIFEIAPQCQDTKFILMGSQCDAFKGRYLPQNVGLLGIVSDEVKDKVFSVADFALNPMQSGSGTNLKMFDYMAAGVPVISTEIGVRGIDRQESVIIVKDAEEFVQAVNAFSLEEMEKAVGDARKYTEEVFDWQVIGQNYIQKLSMIEK